MSPVKLLLSVALLLTVLVAAGCSGDDSDDIQAQDEPVVQVQAEHEEIGHIHGLGVDPADGSLQIASHHGLFRVQEGERTVERVGDRASDLMGFLVVGPGHYLASGHPGPGEPEPPLLGLIETTDGGQEWSEISLTGEADFHAMAASGQKIYGYESSRSTFMVSDDGGETWTEHQPPNAILSLAVDPEDPDRVVASTMEALFETEDAGNTWSPLPADPGPGFLAWPTAERIYHVDVNGQVRLGTADGSSWEVAGSIGGLPVALTAHGSEELHAARDDLAIVRSGDGGASWTEILPPVP